MTNFKPTVNLLHDLWGGWSALARQSDAAPWMCFRKWEFGVLMTTHIWKYISPVAGYWQEIKLFKSSTSSFFLLLSVGPHLPSRKPSCQWCMVWIYWYTYYTLIFICLIHSDLASKTDTGFWKTGVWFDLAKGRCFGTGILRVRVGDCGSLPCAGKDLLLLPAWSIPACLGFQASNGESFADIHTHIWHHEGVWHVW